MSKQLTIINFKEQIDCKLVMIVHELLCDYQTRCRIWEVKVILHVNGILDWFPMAYVFDWVILQQVVEHW